MYEDKADGDNYNHQIKSRLFYLNIFMIIPHNFAPIIYFYPLIQVLPAIIGFLVTGLLILRFVFDVKIPEYNENPPGIIISSFIFISSGFVVEIIYINWYSILSWIKDNSGTAFIFTILGSFLTSRYMKKLADDKEKREITILFQTSIDAQVIALQAIKKIL